MTINKLLTTDYQSNVRLLLAVLTVLLLSVYCSLSLHVSITSPAVDYAVYMSAVGRTLYAFSLLTNLYTYVGQRIDGPSNGAAPLPWDVHCNPTKMFHSEVRHVEVPHTAIVTVCHIMHHCMSVCLSICLSVCVVTDG